MDALREFRRRLDAFVFFHLGYDAEVTWREEEGKLSVRLEHGRIHPIEFELDSSKLEELAADPHAGEEFLLEFLARHRRGGIADFG